MKMYVEAISLFFAIFHSCVSTNVPLEVYPRFGTERHNSYKFNHYNVNFYKKKLQEHTSFKILYQIGSSDDDLPECGPQSVCNKIDLYDVPWVEKQCRCPGGKQCPMSLAINDGHTFVERTRQYKVCEPIRKLPKCRYFFDITWSITVSENNVTNQIINCHCPKRALAYIKEERILSLPSGKQAHQFLFTCSPPTRFSCQRKEPCRLFTVRKRQDYLDEVNVNSLCQCPSSHRCPHHHLDYGVIPSKSEDIFKAYTAFCIPT